jgi:hypothetical protein
MLMLILIIDADAIIIDADIDIIIIHYITPLLTLMPLLIITPLTLRHIDIDYADYAIDAIISLFHYL